MLSRGGNGLLVFAQAGPDGMHVRIDQPRQHSFSAKIDRVEYVSLFPYRGPHHSRPIEP